MGTISNAAKTGFGFALGFSALQLIGVILFVLGFLLVRKDSEKKGTQFGIGIALMVLGVAMGFGTGFDTLLNSFNS